MYKQQNGTVDFRKFTRWHEYVQRFVLSSKKGTVIGQLHSKLIGESGR